MKIILLAIMLIACIFLYKNPVNFIISRLSMRQIPVNKSELNSLILDTGITFPPGSVLINSSGGGRDESSGFVVRCLYSPESIEMPKMKAVGVKDYLKIPLSDAVSYVQELMNGATIDGPREALSSEWISPKGYTLRGTLVHAAKGDYIIIEQFGK